MQLNYIGSFQDRRFVLRTGDQLAAAWREVERAGTKDSLARIAGLAGAGIDDIRSGSFRIRQAVELQAAAKDTSMLTRPLLLYYSSLNLIRGWLCVHKGGMGKPRHGATFKAGGSLLDCSAILDKSAEGTLPRLFEFYGQDKKSAAGLEMSLKSCLAQIPELKRDFTLIPDAVSDIAWVEVNAKMHGPLSLRYHIQNCSEQEFSTNWHAILPWMKDECVLSQEGPFTLKLKQEGLERQQVTEFCERRLMSMLHLSNEPIWFDQVQRKGMYLLPGRLLPYLIALFILSNVCRYEPQLFEETLTGSTDVAFVITSLLRCAERYIPQIFVSAAYGGTVFFE